MINDSTVSKIIKSWLAYVLEIDGDSKEIAEIEITLNSLEKNEKGDTAISISGITTQIGCHDYMDLVRQIYDPSKEWVFEHGNGNGPILNFNLSCIDEDEDIGSFRKGFFVLLFSHPEDPTSIYRIESPIIEGSDENNVYNVLFETDKDSLEEINIESFSITRFENVNPELTCKKAKTSITNIAKSSLDTVYAKFPDEANHESREYIFDQILKNDYGCKYIDVKKLIAHTHSKTKVSSYEVMREIELITNTSTKNPEILIDLNKNKGVFDILIIDNGYAPVAVYPAINTSSPQESSVTFQYLNGEIAEISYRNFITGRLNRGDIADSDVLKFSILNNIFHSEYAEISPKEFLLACFQQQVSTGNCKVDLKYKATGRRYDEVLKKILTSPDLTHKLNV